MAKSGVGFRGDSGPNAPIVLGMKTFRRNLGPFHTAFNIYVVISEMRTNLEVVDAR